MERNGYDALLKLKHFLPDLIIPDLNTPRMSGFEFRLVVRRTFSEISVIASSGAYGSRVVPTGVLADAFLQRSDLPCVSKGEEKAVVSRVCCPGGWSPGIKRCNSFGEAQRFVARYPGNRERVRIATSARLA